jgi:hypothetical protein
MISKAAVESAAEAAAPGSKEGAWKWAIRKQVRAASWSAVHVSVPSMDQQQAQTANSLIHITVFHRVCKSPHPHDATCAAAAAAVVAAAAELSRCGTTWRRMILQGGVVSHRGTVTGYVPWGCSDLERLHVPHSGGKGRRANL